MGGWAKRGYSINIDKIGRRNQVRQDIYMVFPTTASPKEDARGQGQEKVELESIPDYAALRAQHIKICRMLFKAYLQWFSTCGS